MVTSQYCLSDVPLSSISSLGINCVFEIPLLLHNLIPWPQKPPFCLLLSLDGGKQLPPMLRKMQLSCIFSLRFLLVRRYQSISVTKKDFEFYLYTNIPIIHAVLCWVQFMTSIFKITILNSINCPSLLFLSLLGFL